MRDIKRSRWFAWIIATGLVAAPGCAVAGAFHLNERSAAAQGASFSGSASAAGDVTFATFNPAALSTVESAEVGGNLSLIWPISDGTVKTGPSAGRNLDADVFAVVPATAFGYRVTDDLTLGLSVYGPFGLKTEYKKNYPVSADAIHSELVAVNVAPAIAWEVTDNLTLGAAFNILYADARLTNSIVRLEGDDFAFGFSVGMLFEPVEGTKIGAAYHHGYELDFDTDAFLGLPGAVDASLPNWVQLGITHSLTEDVRLMAEARWINWSRFDSIDISTPGLAGTPLGEVSDPQNYKDAWFFALGAEYDASDRLTLRGGIAWDETPTTDAFRTARVPDEDRIWLSAGLTWAVSDAISVDLAYSYLFTVRKADVTLRNGPAAGTRLEYDGGAHILSIGGAFRF